ncbi:elongation factor P [Candidatus Peregrinibacteria bacterium]|nr:elongation factor P [Candidatus Peregrinibacteria bacterium]
MYSIAEVRPGMTIQIENIPYLVLHAQHSKQARGGGVAKTSLKNLLTGSTIPKTFQGNERIEKANVHFSKAQYLYKDESSAYFMDSNNFEQFSIPADQIKDQSAYLLEGTEIDIQNFDNKPIAIKLPPKVVLAVTETEPGVRGNTASGGSKPAILETGIRIQVPLFINQGDRIRINTETGQYAERA